MDAVYSWEDEEKDEYFAILSNQGNDKYLEQLTEAHTKGKVMGKVDISGHWFTAIRNEDG